MSARLVFGHRPAGPQPLLERAAGGCVASFTRSVLAGAATRRMTCRVAEIFPAVISLKAHCAFAFLGAADRPLECRGGRCGTSHDRP
jgi:hypothetical protein